MLSNKTYFIIFVTLLFLSLANGQVFASEMEGQMKEINVEMKDIYFSGGTNDTVEAESMIRYNNKRFYPLRDMIKKTNKSIKWDGETRSIIVESNSQPFISYQFEKQYSFALKDSDKNLSFETNIDSEGGIVIEDGVDHVMFEKNSNLKFYPASTVKIMTALLAIENGNLDDIVTISDEVNNLPYDSRRAYIQPGDQLTLEQLLYGMLVYSGNDCALAIAEHIAGSEEKFVQMMNDKANSLGAKNTNFKNPHGYHDSNQYTTPFDLAIITKEAAKSEEFLEMIHTANYKAVFKDKNGKTKTRYWDTTNQFLKNENVNLKGIIGGKTGYTDASKYNLVTISNNNGHQYISVILKGEHWSRFYDTQKIIEKAYKVRSSYEQKFANKISVSTDIGHLIVNGKKLNHKNEVFIYNQNAYVSETMLKRILSSNMITEKTYSNLNERVQQDLSKVLLKSSQFLVSQSFLNSASPLALMNTLFHHTILNNEIIKYSKLFKEIEVPFQRIKVHKIQVRYDDHYLTYKPIRL